MHRIPHPPPARNPMMIKNLPDPCFTQPNPHPCDPQDPWAFRPTQPTELLANQRKHRARVATELWGSGFCGVRRLFLFAPVSPGQKFPGEFAVGGGSSAVGVIGDDRLAMAGGLADPDPAGDQGFVDAFTEVLENLLDHLLRQIGAHVVHGHDNAFDTESGVCPAVPQLLDQLRHDR